jgi:S-DNA-T family DNA segregation ATPase FtsK/SpoIIIE
VRLLAAGLAARFVPTHLHLYAVSGGLALAPLVALNHVGGVVGAEEIARLRRLLHLLRETRAATEVGAATAAPGIVVLLDDWDQLCRVGAPTKEIVEEIVETALDQQAHGVTVVAAGGPVLARDRLLRAARTIVLSGLDASDVRPSSFGADPPPGRGVLAEDGSAVQLASLADEPPLPHQAHGPATQDGFPRPVIDLPRRWARPSPIDASRVPRRAVRSLPRAADDICLPLGVGHTGPVTWQPKRWGRHLLVGGYSGSGRTSTLLTLAQSLAEADGRTIIVTDDGHRFEGLGTLLDTRDAPALGAALRDQPGAAVLVDDADALTSSPVGTVLTEWVDRLETVSGLMVVTVRMHTLTTAFRGLVPALAARQTALLLDPSSRHDGDALGVRIEPPATRTAGRGVVIVRGRVEEIQVAHPDPLPRAASYSGTAGGPTDPAHRTPPEGRQIPAAQHSAKAVLPRSA